MKSIIVSAPGKLMLLGEHAVVYNHPCLVTAVNQRMRATVTVLATSEFSLEASDVKITDYKKSLDKLGKGDIPKGAQFVEIAIRNVFKKYNLKNGIAVKTQSEFSSQFGFGSSSASTVCVVKALSELFNLKLSQKQIFEISYKTVLDIQGKGSGFDIAAATYGGTLYFFTGGKSIEPLRIKHLPLVVGYSGVKADTVTLMNRVQKKFARNPKKLKSIYQNIEQLVREAKRALMAENWFLLGALMDDNQAYLEELGVSMPKLDAMISLALDKGALGAKLSGAGGGDCMIALHDGKNEYKIRKAIESVGGEIIPIKPNAEGVRVEN